MTLLSWQSFSAVISGRPVVRKNFLEKPKSKTNDRSAYSSVYDDDQDSHNEQQFGGLKHMIEQLTTKKFENYGCWCIAKKGYGPGYGLIFWGGDISNFLKTFTDNDNLPEHFKPLISARWNWLFLHETFQVLGMCKSHEWRQMWRDEHFIQMAIYFGHCDQCSNRHSLWSVKAKFCPVENWIHRKIY